MDYTRSTLSWQTHVRVSTTLLCGAAMSLYATQQGATRLAGLTAVLAVTGAAWFGVGLGAYAVARRVARLDPLDREWLRTVRADEVQAARAQVQRCRKVCCNPKAKAPRTQRTAKRWQ